MDRSCHPSFRCGLNTHLRRKHFKAAPQNLSQVSVGGGTMPCQLSKIHRSGGSNSCGRLSRRPSDCNWVRRDRRPDFHPSAENLVCAVFYRDVPPFKMRIFSSSRLPQQRAWFFFAECNLTERTSCVVSPLRPVNRSVPRTPFAASPAVALSLSSVRICSRRDAKTADRWQIFENPLMIRKATESRPTARNATPGHSLLHG